MPCSHYHTYNTVLLVWLSPAKMPCCRNKHQWSTYDSPIRACHEPPWILITNSLPQNLLGWMPQTSGLNHTAAWAARAFISPGSHWELSPCHPVYGPEPRFPSYSLPETHRARDTSLVVEWFWWNDWIMCSSWFLWWRRYFWGQKKSLTE